MKIRFLGTHNTKSNSTDYSSLIINEILALDAGSLASGLSFTEQEKIKAILLSHGHYDHISEIPAFFFNNSSHTTRVYSSRKTFEVLSAHLVDGLIYPNFTEKIITCEKHILEFHQLEPLVKIHIDNYTILPVPVNHPLEALGFEIASLDDKKIFYTGDTGYKLSEVWRHINPDLIIIDMTLPNRFENLAIQTFHMCPHLLKIELTGFIKEKGYIPKIFPVHISPQYEAEIREELNKIAQEMSLKIVNTPEDREIII